ncbi:MAG: baseplate J/gp47 family protein [Caldicoprobacter oshimai]
MSEINFVEVNAQELANQLLKDFEAALGETLYPGDERRIFLMQLLQVIVGLKNDINQSARQNLLRYATGECLDALGEFYGTKRIPAQKARTTLQFTLSSAQGQAITIPAGTRVTPDGELYFATTRPLTIPAGEMTGTVEAEALEGGARYNNFAPGQIKTLVDPLPYVATVENIDTSAGGADVEDDESYRERIRLAPASFSVAGPERAYIYWAKTADVNIADVAVTSTAPGVVNIVVLMKGGQIPSQDVLDKVAAAVNAKDRRPLTDKVEVAAPEAVTYDINLTYYISADRQAEEAALKQVIEAAVNQYITWQAERLGRAINPDYLRQLMLNAGAYRIDITSPAFMELEFNQVAQIGNINITYGGLL